MARETINIENVTADACTDNPVHGIHVVAKPMGPVCNLACEYCFYLEKKVLFGPGEDFRMSDEVLSSFVSRYITAQPTPVVEFVWQGGEPTLAGLDFFRRVVREQKPYTKDRTIKNALQTNGTILTDEWCVFLKKNNFIVGISMDGPQEIHNRYRRNRKGEGSFDQVMRALELLQKHKVEYNVLACVAKETAEKPLEVYRFFRDTGVKFIQFAPVVERLPDTESAKAGLRLASPAALDRENKAKEVTPWSVVPEAYGDFLIAVYEEWVRHDVGRIFVMNFEWALNAWIGNPSPVCIHAQQCGRSLVMEHNGDVFACDHCVYHEYRLGNIKTDQLSQMAKKSLASGFGISKEKMLPDDCKECEVLVACRGGCPKHRFATTFDDKPGLQYLCEGYKKFFLHIRKYLRAMTQLLDNNMPASLVMDAIKAPLVIRK